MSSAAAPNGAASARRRSAVFTWLLRAAARTARGRPLVAGRVGRGNRGVVARAAPLARRAARRLGLLGALLRLGLLLAVGGLVARAGRGRRVAAHARAGTGRRARV